MSAKAAAHCLSAIALALQAHIVQDSRPSREQMESMVAAAADALKESASYEEAGVA